MSAYSTRTEHLATGQSLDRWIATLHQAASARSSQPLPPPHEWVRDYWPGRNVFVNDIKAVLLRGTRISDDDLRSLIDALNDIAFIYQIKPTSPAAIRKGQTLQTQKQTKTNNRPHRDNGVVRVNVHRFKYCAYVLLSRTMASLSFCLGFSRSTYTNWLAKGECPAEILTAPEFINLGITDKMLKTPLSTSERLELEKAEKELNVKRRTKREQAMAA